jgi:antitoxin component YwqK of YwqJK toxin-antitoxin module
MSKLIKYSFILTLLAGIAYLVYFFFLTSRDSFQAIYLVPKDAVYIIETNEPVKSWKKVAASKVWKHMQEQPYFGELTASANSLDSMIRSNETLFDLLGSRTILISSHVYAPKKYDHLFVVDLQEASKLDFLQKYLTRLDNDSYKVTERSHKGVEITEMYDKKDKSTLYIAFIKNLVACSYTHSLVEAAIEQMDEPVIARDHNFIKVKQSVGNDGLCNIYLNYSMLGNYMMCYLSSQDESVSELSKSLLFTGLNLELDEQDKIVMDGYTGINDSVSSYLKAMLASGKGSLTAQEVIPQRTAYYMSLSVKDFGKFYDNMLELKRKSDPTFPSYEKDLQQMEKYLKISVKDNFVKWVGDEVSFVQTQPKGLGRKNEYAVVIKANDIVMAKDNLAYMLGQIKKRTPVKFKEFDYKGYPINYMEVKGFFKLVLGKFFKGLDKPYYTIIGDYVIMSNHPQTVKSIIDDFKAGRTLKNQEDYNTFLENFDKASNVFVYANMPVLHAALEGFVDTETWASMKTNKDYIICFPHLGFQLKEKDELFEAKFVSLYKDMNEVKQQLAKINTDVSPVNQIQNVLPEEENDENNVEDLDAKVFEEKYPDGSIKSEVALKNGLRNGVYKEYYPNGEVKVKGSYENDMKEGTFKYYDDQGNLNEKKRFEKGREVK